MRRRGPALAALLLLACAREAAPPAPGAPPTPRAAFVLEPASLELGQVSEIELAVVTPPGERPHPYAPPAEVPGLWILGAEALPVEQEPTRWIHRTRIRVRARAPGDVQWPAARIEVDAADGSASALEAPALALEVHSPLGEEPARRAPFGPRAPAAGARGSEPWGPAAAGALTALSCVGLVALARRRAARLRDSAAAAPAPAGPAPWECAAEQLASARARAAAEPFAAAFALSSALREYAAARFGADAVARTGEELARAEPPFAARSRWPALLAILSELDALRFRPEGDGAVRAALEARLPQLLGAAERFVADSAAPGARP